MEKRGVCGCVVGWIVGLQAVVRFWFSAVELRKASTVFFGVWDWPVVFSNGVWCTFEAK